MKNGCDLWSNRGLGHFLLSSCSLLYMHTYACEYGRLNPRKSEWLHRHFGRSGCNVFVIHSSYIMPYKRCNTVTACNCTDSLHVEKYGMFSTSQQQAGLACPDLYIQQLYHSIIVSCVVHKRTIKEEKKETLLNNPWTSISVWATLLDWWKQAWDWNKYQVAPSHLTLHSISFWRAGVMQYSSWWDENATRDEVACCSLISLTPLHIWSEASFESLSSWMMAPHYCEPQPCRSPVLLPASVELILLAPWSFHIFNSLLLYEEYTEAAFWVLGAWFHFLFHAPLG